MNSQIQDVTNFNTEKMEKTPDYTATVIGKRGVGKTTLIKDLLIKTNRQNIYVFSGTESGNGFYKQNFPDAIIYNEFNETVLQNLITNQKNIIDKTDTDFLVPITIVFDDLAIVNHRKSNALQQIIFNGRHYKITLITELQYARELPPQLRTNVDFVFALKENVKDNVNKLYENYFGMFQKFSDFQTVFRSCTEDYGAIVMDNCSKSSRMEDLVFWYKADRWPLCTEKIPKDVLKVKAVTCKACHKEYVGDVGLLQHHTRNKMCKKWTDILEKNNETAKKIQETYEESHNLRTTKVNKCEACEKEFSNVGNLNKHFRGNPECQKLCALGFAQPNPDLAANTIAPDPIQKTKWVGPNGDISDYKTDGYRPVSVEINFKAYDPKSSVFEPAPPSNDSKLVHIIWNLLLTDKTQVNKDLVEEISKNNIKHIIAILPYVHDLPDIPSSVDVNCTVLTYGNDHNPIISDEILEKYEECYEKIAEMQKKRENVLIFCNNGYQRSLPFICNYLIKHHADEVPDLDRALDIVLSQVDKENYSVVKEATKNTLLMLRTEYMTPFFDK